VAGADQQRHRHRVSTLAQAFEDNESAAAAVGVEGAEVTLAVVVPSTDALPDRRPTTTPAGNLSLKKLTRRETSDFYKLLVCGHVLVTVKEAFAVAPAITSARIVAVRHSPPDAYGDLKPEVVLAARFEKARLDGILWLEADAARVVNDASSELILIQKGASQELAAIDTAGEVDLAEVGRLRPTDDVTSGNDRGYAHPVRNREALGWSPA
jgi:hypothetical protein